MALPPYWNGQGKISPKLDRCQGIFVCRKSQEIEEWRKIIYSEKILISIACWLRQPCYFKHECKQDTCEVEDTESRYKECGQLGLFTSAKEEAGEMQSQKPGMGSQSSEPPAVIRTTVQSNWIQVSRIQKGIKLRIKAQISFPRSDAFHFYAGPWTSLEALYNDIGFRFLSISHSHGFCLSERKHDLRIWIRLGRLLASPAKHGTLGSCTC